MEPGLIPLVVGVVSTPEGLERAAAADSWPCDVVEIRLDLIGEESCDWTVAALRLTKAGLGTLLTVRHVSEGGRWTGDEQARLDCYLQGIPLVTGVDVELGADILADVVSSARDRVTIIGSHHNFRAMPDVSSLCETVRSGRSAGVDVVKIAAFASDELDLRRMTGALKKCADSAVCMLAMGPQGPASRISLPLAGSCLTYGFLDKPNAPGQPSAGEIRDALMAKHDEYRVFAEIRAGDQA